MKNTHDVICCGFTTEPVLEMAVEQSASPMISNVFLHNCASKLEDDGTGDNSNSPHLSRRSLNELESSEKSGIPLNTPWTLWHDK